VDERKQVYQFLVELKDITPRIWRQIQVPATYTFWDLHVAIQDAMGWEDCHLHAFRVKNPQTKSIEEIGIPDGESFNEGSGIAPGWKANIADYFKKNGNKASYEYDFGDGWEHMVVLEAILDRQKGVKYPVCLAGERACPPEDCGGTFGYEDLLGTIHDPANEEYEETMEWLGAEFDPEYFDPKEVVFSNPKQRLKTAGTE